MFNKYMAFNLSKEMEFQHNRKIYAKGYQTESDFELYFEFTLET